MYSIRLALLSFCVFLLLHEQIIARKHNVLLIYVDDLRPLSHKDVHLPNILKMAAKGVRFKNTFAQQALCAPSRNSMLTGRKPDALRLYDFYSYWRNTSGNFTTLPQLFKQSDYDTYSVGKVFHPGPSSNFDDDARYSWSHVYHPPTEKYKDAPVCNDTAKTKELHKNLICPVIVEDQPGKTLPDLESLNYSLKILKERNSSKPFFLAVGFYKPHIPLKYPAKYLEKIPIEKVRPPKHASIPKNMPLVAYQPWMDIRKRDDIKRLQIEFPMGVMPKEWALKIRQSYYAAASYVDDLVGMLMRHVDKRRTIVVLTSDHEKIPIEKVRPPKHASIPKNMPLVAYQPWMDIRKRDDIKRLQIEFPMGVMPKEWALKIRQSYYAAASYVDDLVGMLMRHVDKRRTIVVLTSDHGWSLGENGLWAKYSNFDAALKVPLIFQVPKIKRKSIEAPVEALDVFPTLVELAGLSKSVPKCRDVNDKSVLCFDGKSLVPLIKTRHKDYPNKSFAISQYPRPSSRPTTNSDRPRLHEIEIMGYSIRTERYRYTEWIKFNNKLFTRNWNKTYGIELYDHLRDPDESNNLHLKPQYKQIQKYLSKLLRSQVDPNN